MTFNMLKFCRLNYTKHVNCSSCDPGKSSQYVAMNRLPNEHLFQMRSPHSLFCPICRKYTFWHTDTTAEGMTISQTRFAQAATQCTRRIRKVSTIRLFKKNDDLFSMNFFFIRYAIPYTTFLHSFHHYWGIYRNGIPISVFPRRRT
jgi:hypothetical protein